MDNLKQIIKINNKKQVQAHNKQMYQTQYKILKQMKIIKNKMATSVMSEILQPWNID
jgi:hypothetical protein